VENAIYHGIKPKLNKGIIKINVFEENNILNIVVTDDGIGIRGEKLEQIKNNLKEHLTSDSYGLYNVNQRIYLYYGNDYGLTIESSEISGTSIVIKLPVTMEKDIHV
jgi:two-component system sensor histidine kinase YesM